MITKRTGFSKNQFTPPSALKNPWKEEPRNGESLPSKFPEAPGPPRTSCYNENCLSGKRSPLMKNPTTITLNGRKKPAITILLEKKKHFSAFRITSCLPGTRKPQMMKHPSNPSLGKKLPPTTILITNYSFKIQTKKIGLRKLRAATGDLPGES